MKTILSYGGGVGSTALLLLMKDKIDEAVFVNHGGDYPETYQFVEFISKKIFPITIIKSNIEGFSNLYEYMWHKRIIPSYRYRWCTDKFKIRPITKYIKQKYGKAIVLIGYTFDERKRIKPLRNGLIYKYPLVEMKITREKAKEIIKENGLPIPKKSACWFCPFAKKSEIKELKEKYPKLFKKLVELHRRCQRKDIALKFGVKDDLQDMG